MTATEYAKIRKVGEQWWVDVFAPFNKTFLWQWTWFFSTKTSAEQMFELVNHA